MYRSLVLLLPTFVTWSRLYKFAMIFYFLFCMPTFFTFKPTFNSAFPFIAFLFLNFCFCADVTFYQLIVFFLWLNTLRFILVIHLYVDCWQFKSSLRRVLSVAFKISSRFSYFSDSPLEFCNHWWYFLTFKRY